MKKIISLFAALSLMVAGVPACADAAQTATAEPAADAQTLTVEDKLNNMLPALDSVVRSLSYDPEAGYAPADAAYFWDVIYLMGVNWGYNSPLASTVTQDDISLLSLPRQAVQEMATAAFYDYNDLLELTGTGSVTYDEATDCYLFALSDAGETQTRIDSYTEQENGNIDVVAGFYDASTDTRESGYEFTLVANPYTDAVSEPTYYYSIMSVTVEAATAAAN